MIGKILRALLDNFHPSLVLTRIDVRRVTYTRLYVIQLEVNKGQRFYINQYAITDLQLHQAVNVDIMLNEVARKLNRQLLESLAQESPQDANRT